MSVVGDRAARTRAQAPVLAMHFPVRDATALRDNFGKSRGGGSRTHRGVDIEAPRGSTIEAARAGTVEQSTRGGRPDDVMGHYVRVRDDENGSVAWYFHMNEAPRVGRGEHVARGQALGVVGDTGRADGPHLHFQVADAAGRFLDPYPSLRLARATVEGFDVVGADDDATRARWVAFNAAATALATQAAGFRWPQAMLDDVPERSETRNQLRDLRNSYQATMRTRLATYRAHRDRGNFDGAADTIEAMRALNERMGRNVRNLQRIFDRTLVENIAHGFDLTEAAVRDALSHAVEVVEQSSFGIGLGIGLVALLFLAAKGRR